VRQTASQVEYDIGDDSYAIPKALVERVEEGGSPVISSPSGSGHEALPTFTPSMDVAQDAASLKVIHDGRVDEDALSALDRGSDAAQAASGYFAAGKFAYERGRREQARSYFRRALIFEPDHAAALTYYAAVLMQSGSLAEAASAAERATRIAPDSPDAWAVLGFIYFSSDRNQQAANAWKKALALRPDPGLQRYLAKVERELHAEADYDERDSSHFVLHYEGSQSSDALRRAMLDTLESDYQELTSALDVAPRNSIAVVLYTDQTFFDVTQAPAWTAALNDGKLRIPIHGMTGVSPELARVLKHELAHSFINQVSHGRAPQWLHEGIAQLVEGRTLSGRGARLAEVFQQKRNIPYNALEGGFMNMSTPVAVLAYDESLAAAEYINATYGMSDLRRILERIGDGSTTEAALRATVHSSYADLETEIGKYLQQRYGN
jgi:tetratricopeptide (TPR) repeat protein